VPHGLNNRRAKTHHSMKEDSYHTFLKILTFAALFVCPVLIYAQQHVRILGENGQPVEDAIITYHPLNLKSFQKVAITDANGRADLQTETPVSLVISRIGYTTVADTLKVKESRTIVLKASNLNLKDVVVTGQFEAVTADKSVHKIKVIDRKRIEQQGAVNLRDVLSNELNIRLTQDGVLGAQMSMMGIGGQNVKILVDGVPMIGRMDGNLDLSQINMNNVERIEIVEGPMGVIYGTDALGGVINIITKKPDGKQYNAFVNTYYESVGTYNIDGGLGVKYKDLQVSVSGGRNFFDGYSENEDPRLRVLQWKPREQYFGDVQLRYKYKRQNHRLTSQYFHEQIINRQAPTITPYRISAFDDYYITERFNNSLYSDFLFNNRASLSLINSYSTFERRSDKYVKDLVTGNEQLSADPESHDTTKFGLALMRATYSTNNQTIFNSQMGYDINLETGTGKRLENSRQHIYDFAGFYIAELKPVSRLTLRQGIRFIYNTRYGAPVIPSFNVKYDLTSNWAIRGSYAQGFRAPSLKELSLSFVDRNHTIFGNEDLKAERSNNYTASLAYSSKIKETTFKGEATFFYNDIRDMIGLSMLSITSDSQVYRYINVDKFKSMGLNLTASVQVKNLSVTTGYGRTGRSNQFSTTTQVPEFSYSDEFNLNPSYHFPKAGVDVSMFYKYTGRTPVYATVNGEVMQIFTDGFSMLDGSITKSFRKGLLSVSVGAKNLLDVKSINRTAAVGGGAHSSGSTSLLMAMGRFYFMSVKINIGKL
jgi:outer membrane receptor for ferrienterochelin and colicins